MNRKSLRGVNLATVFITVLLLAISAGLSSSKASQELDVSDSVVEQK
ncbi:hypothetical protein [Thalassotalea maritima]